ncbi:PAS domain S-box protein [Pseudomonas matsuisoli]|uniref:histidine kinase n=1 Tax=Pseudomonas matsuisoli TaxID=1515666 RepID=A0A917PYG3_9PSED|nr:PAS domain S-box protein [Pseudomonas matsuisoli]GGK01070.1 hypothetical protein GCM10009304_28610 [Pseudomonas matsuisoli]
MTSQPLQQLQQRLAALEAENRALCVQLDGRRDMSFGGLDLHRMAIFNSAIDHAIIAMDLDGRVTGWNIGAERLFGWTSAEMVGHSIECLLGPEDRAAGWADLELRNVLEKGRFESERWQVRADGQRFWGAGETTPLRTADGEQIGYFKVLHDRTEQHQVRLRLEEEEARYRALVDSIDAGFCIIEMAFDENGRGRDYRFIEVNPAFERHTGIANAAGRWMREIAAEHEQHWFDIYGEVALTGKPVRFENNAEALGRWYDVYAVRIGDPAAARVGILFNDLSERRQAELALARSEAHWRGVFETLQEGFILGELIRDASGQACDWRYLDVNPAWGTMLGIPLEGVAGRSVRDVVPGIEPEWISHIANVVETSVSEEFVRQVGVLGRWYEGRVHHLDGDRFAVTFQDVTQRRLEDVRRRGLLDLLDRFHDLGEIESMAYAAAEMLGRTLAVSRAGYCTLDERYRAVTVERDWALPGMPLLAGTHSLRSISGFADTLLRGESVVVDDIRADPRTQGHAVDMEALSIGSMLQVPITELGRTVAVFFVCRSIVTHWQQEDIAFVLEVASRARAAIERRRAEQKLRALNASLEREVGERTEALLKSEEKLRQSQKMEAVGQLTGGLAHDFNNLLTGIAGSLELLQNRIAKGRLEGLERYMQAAQGASTRAASLTHRLLAFSRQQTLDPKPVNINSLVEGMEELVRRTVGPSIEIDVECTMDLWLTLVDRNQLENALLNLCINARDAMEGGGCLLIETSNVWMNSRTAAEVDLPVGHYVALSVIDNGCGMPSDVVAKAFDPFFTTKPLGMGTGLGLSMIYGFARQSGGQVKIASVFGQGTAVTLYMPRYVGETQADNFEVPPDMPRTGAGETVLVVDDEPTVRMLITDVLEDMGYRALEAGDAESGLQALQSSSVRIDLLISDIGLPGGMNGRQMADQARIARPQLKVLFITGYAESDVFGVGQLPSGMHLLTKPFGIDVLGRKVKELLTKAPVPPG